MFLFINQFCEVLPQIHLNILISAIFHLTHMFWLCRICGFTTFWRTPPLDPSNLYYWCNKSTIIRSLSILANIGPRYLERFLLGNWVFFRVNLSTLSLWLSLNLHSNVLYVLILNSFDSNACFQVPNFALKPLVVSSIKKILSTTNYHHDISYGICLVLTKAKGLRLKADPWRNPTTIGNSLVSSLGI